MARLFPTSLPQRQHLVYRAPRFKTVWMQAGQAARWLQRNLIRTEQNRSG